MPTFSHLPAWAYRLLAALAACLGIALSVVTGKFFILGLQRLEPNELARDALAIAGLLMIIAEVVAFFIFALLPKKIMRPLRALLFTVGILLVTFEAVTVFTTQQALIQSSQSTREGVQARIDYLRTSIDKAQQSAINIRQTAQEQVGSRFINQRQDATQLLKTAQELEAQANAQATELSQLLDRQQHTLEQTLGEGGVLIYSVARAALLSVTGLIMMSAAGVLLRASRAVPAIDTVPATVLDAPPAVPPTVPSTVLDAALPYESAVPAIPPAVPPTVPIVEPESQDGRYNTVRDAVVGGMTPSVRAIQELAGGSTGVARELQAALLAKGVIERAGQGYRLADKKPA